MSENNDTQQRTYDLSGSNQPPRRQAPVRCPRKNKKLTTCKACGATVAKKAKTCPGCGARIAKGGCLIALLKGSFVFAGILILIALIAGPGEDTPDDALSAAPPVQEQPAPEIEYTAVTADQLLNALEENAYNAKQNYTDMYVELTGRLGSMDASGRYFAMRPTDELYFTLDTITCNLSAGQQENLTSLKTDDLLTIRGKIIAVGELLGYEIKIDEFVK